MSDNRREPETDTQWWSILYKMCLGAGETAQWLREHIALSEEPTLDLSTNTTSNSGSWGICPLWPRQVPVCTCTLFSSSLLLSRFSSLQVSTLREARVYRATFCGPSSETVIKPLQSTVLEVQTASWS